MAVGHWHKIVVCPYDSNIASRACRDRQRRIQISGCHFPKQGAGQVHFMNLGAKTVNQPLAEINQEMSLGRSATGLGMDPLGTAS